MERKKKAKRFLEVIRSMKYIEIIDGHEMSEMSKKSYREYERSAIRYGKLCRKICKREGWEIKKEESTNG